MRCFNCYNLSIKAICKECINDFLQPNITKKEIANLEVISFFDYYIVENIIKSKYIPAGYRVYKQLGKEFIAPFIANYVNNLNNKNIYLIGVDEHYNRGYSNISQLIHYGAKEAKIKALHNVLTAKNRVQYAGKSLEFRLNNSRNFTYTGPKNIEAILIDDTITTGTTLQEAYRVLKANSVNIHFALTLASVKDGIDY